MNLTRRDIGKLALAALPAAALRAAKPNSVFGGVQVGINAPYSFHNIPGGAEDILGYMNRLNLSAAELRLQPVEAYLNAPVVPPAPRGNAPPLTPETGSGTRRPLSRLSRKWRLSRPMSDFKNFPQEVRRRRRAHPDREVRRHQPDA